MQIRRLPRISRIRTTTNLCQRIESANCDSKPQKSKMKTVTYKSKRSNAFVFSVVSKRKTKWNKMLFFVSFTTLQVFRTSPNLAFRSCLTVWKNHACTIRSPEHACWSTFWWKILRETHLTDHIVQDSVPKTTKVCLFGSSNFLKSSLLVRNNWGFLLFLCNLIWWCRYCGALQ